MTALSNFTTTTTTTMTPLSLTATLLLSIPIGDRPSSILDGFRSDASSSSSSSSSSSAVPHPVQLRHRRQKASNGHRKNRTGHDAEEDGEDERDKRRRSLNIPEDRKAKELRLFNTRQNSFVQIHEDGTVRTGTQSNSVHSIFEVLFWCHLAPQLFQPCSNSPSSFSAILMRFKATGRYLCMSHSGKIYTQIPGHSLIGVENCIFRHEFLSNQYDVYYSWRYPNGTQHCGSRLQHSPPDASCRTRWYLGVDRRGRLCTVRSSPGTSIRRNSFFIQRWIHDRGQGRPEYPNPLLTQRTPVAERDGTLSKMPPLTTTTAATPLPRVASVFGILSQRRRNERARLAEEEEEEATGVVERNRRGCLNLLKKCERSGKPRKIS